MDSRIIGVTEDMMRRIFNLSDSFVSDGFSAKTGSVEMSMTNSIISLKAKFPMELISAQIEQEDLQDDSKDSEGENTPSDEKEAENITKEQIDTPKHKVRRKKK